MAARRVVGFSSKNKAPICPNPTPAGIENKGENGPTSNAKSFGAVIAPSDWSRARWAWLDAVEEDTELQPSAKVLASVLCRRFADHLTGDCFPGNAALMAAIGGKSEDTVQRAFKALAARGWLRRTEGRGRGSKAAVVFLMPATAARKPARAASPAQAGAGENPAGMRPAQDETASRNARNPQPENTAELRVHNSEKAADMRQKPRSNAASRIEPNTNQNSRATVGAERPFPNQRAVAYFGGDREEAWNAWLRKRGLPSLAQIGALCCDEGGRGYDVPYRLPYGPDASFQHQVQVKWAAWVAEKAEARHDR